MISVAALVAVVVVALVAVVSIRAVAADARRSLRRLEDDVRSLRLAAEAELAAAGGEAERRLDDVVSRGDAALRRAEGAVQHAEVAARLADLALTAPATKARAWTAGFAAVVRTLRQRRALRSGRA